MKIKEYQKEFVEKLEQAINTYLKKEEIHSKWERDQVLLCISHSK